MIYDGAMDIVCHPVGNFNMLDATETWSGKEVPFSMKLLLKSGDKS